MLDALLFRVLWVHRWVFLRLAKLDDALNSQVQCDCSVHPILPQYASP
jgi:hypothetical protein